MSTKQLTDLGTSLLSTRYAVWELVSGTWQVIDTDSNLQQLATRHNLPAGSVVTIQQGANRD